MSVVPVAFATLTWCFSDEATDYSNAVLHRAKIKAELDQLDSSQVRAGAEVFRRLDARSARRDLDRNPERA